MNPLPFPWIIVSAKPVIICRTKVDPYKQAQIDFTIRADTNMKWTLFVKDCEFDWILCDLPTHLITMESILLIVQKLDSCNLYVWETRMRNLSSCTSKGQSLYMESQILILVCLMHSHLMPPLFDIRIVNGLSVEVLLVYQPLPNLIQRLEDVKQYCRSVTKKCERLKSKLLSVSEAQGISVDNQSHQQIMVSETPTMLKDLPENSFRRVFWEQQFEAAKQKDARTMRWHPLMIRWCLYLRHKSSGCYDTLRKCIRLLSEITLQDYTHYVEAKVGFSSDVDKMLISVAKVKTCPNREKCVISLLDEMHIREQLIFDKHSGVITGYANISDIVSHLDEFESKVDDGDESSQTSSERHKLAKTMMVFMVRGLFSSLQFPYAQFACADITRDMLYDPFWEAVRRIETCGLKVLGATLDGCSVNR